MTGGISVSSFEKITGKIRKRLNIYSLILFFVDAIAISLSFLLTLFIKNDLIISETLLMQFVYELPIIILIYWTIFELFQMYRSLWEFAGVEEVIKGVIANIVAAFVSYLIVRMVYENHLRLSYYIIGLFMATMLTLLVRLFFRVYRFITSYFKYELIRKRALIVGAGSAGTLVLNETQKNHRIDATVVGFIDDDPRKIDRTIHSVPVLGSTEEIDLIIHEHAINTVYVAIPKASKERITEILNKVEGTGVKIKLFPPFYEMLQERSDDVKLRDVRIEDLLGRDEIKLDETGIRDYIDGKTIMVTGGGGSIGSELVRQIRHFNPKAIIIVDIYENNAYELQMELDRLYRTNKVKHKPDIIVLIASVRDYERMAEIYKQYQPHVVFHAAAHKHVPLMEVSPKEAIKNNVFGTLNVARLAHEYHVDKFVLISTDKAVNPTNIMGATKRIAEKIIMAFNDQSDTDYAAVRFGNVLGSNGSVIPLFKKQIEEGGPVTVTHPEITRFFMTIPEACQLVIQAGAYANGGELFVLDMGEPMKILDLAQKLIRLSGLEPHKDINIQFTGLRPGEKMYEELLVDKSNVTRTKNNKIFVEPNGNCKLNVFDKLDDLSNALVDDRYNLAKQIKELVPHYEK
ncbi:MAG: nucleoside-diphosphate sugar epimerase/dehydratase [Candidatus Izemoplasma sp.]|nr:nucleoside-diphosphate sugar epimerase/dehydratase [Candidatus Izemoplasma sp.]